MRRQLLLCFLVIMQTMQSACCPCNFAFVEDSNIDLIFFSKKDRCSSSKMPDLLLKWECPFLQVVFPGI